MQIAQQLTIPRRRVGFTIRVGLLYLGSVMATDGFQIDIDDSSQLVQVAGRGFWTLEMIDQHFDRLRAIIAGRRPKWQAVKVLVNIQEALVQPAEIIERIGIRTAQIYEPEDRVAIVVTSNLARMQMRRGVVRLQHEFFLKEYQAIAWLNADGHTDATQACPLPAGH